MAGQTDDVSEHVGRDTPAYDLLVSKALLHEITASNLSDEDLDYVLRLRLGLPNKEWSTKLAEAFRLIPNVSCLQYIVWDGTFWNTGVIKDGSYYRGRHENICRSVLMSAFKVREDAPDSVGTTGNWENHKSFGNSG